MTKNHALAMVLQVPTYQEAFAQIVRWKMAGMIDNATAYYLSEEVNRKFSSQPDSMLGHS